MARSEQSADLPFPLAQSTRAAAIERVQKRLRKYIPSGRLLSEELSAERHAEAIEEDRQ